MYKVLLIDSYDSYTYNLHQLILDVLPDAAIIVIRNDQFTSTSIQPLLPAFDFIVIGPGPGNPCNKDDIGFLRQVFKHDIPILGVCLGFQLICLEYGGIIRRMNTVKHGQVSTLRTSGCVIYPEGENLRVTRYHSLTADIGSCPDLHEIAHVKDENDNGHVSMSVMHNSKPFVGVQYHPESACSHGGTELIKNFLVLCDAWNTKHRTSPRLELSNSIKGLNVRPLPLLHGDTASSTPTGRAEWQVLKFVLTAPVIAELLDVQASERFVVLDSAASPSRYAIVAVTSTSDKTFLYKVGHKECTYGEETIDVAQSGVWHAIADIMHKNKVTHGPREIPFWGGLIGYINYESGVETLEVEPLEATCDAADINLIMNTRSIVIDHQAGTMHVISIRKALGLESDQAWIASICGCLSTAIRTPPASPPIQPVADTVKVALPDKQQYLLKIAKAQQYLAEGQSYELCLTAPTQIVCEPPRRPWHLYQNLRKRNPSPFACYMRLPGVFMLSSSPERFLSWDRDGACQLRPIKGTVRKSHEMTKEKASVILRDPKEFAENLMIVDLIRHDLHQIASEVSVPSLMQVEEYETVFQLVSVITAQVSEPYTGLDALSRALPPGSMTGAPKKRSVELLQGLEGRRRGLYSGVCGYLSVCGGGDWSVIIRTAFRYDSENAAGVGSETWWIGAGGAITALSDPEAEWDEMMLKLDSTLPAF